MAISFNATPTARTLHLSLIAMSDVVLVNAELPVSIVPPKYYSPLVLDGTISGSRKLWYAFNNTFVPQGGGVGTMNYNVIAETCNADLPLAFSYYPVLAAPCTTILLSSFYFCFPFPFSHLLGSSHDERSVSVLRPGPQS
jgi:hypothetical protein